MSSHRPTIVQYTEWHSPSTFSFGATRWRNEMFMAIGFV